MTETHASAEVSLFSGYFLPFLFVHKLYVTALYCMLDSNFIE